MIPDRLLPPTLKKAPLFPLLPCPEPLFPNSFPSFRPGLHIYPALRNTAMGDIQMHKQVAVVFTAAFLYGLYFSTLLFCFRWLLFSDHGWSLRHRKAINWPIVTITMCIFMSTTGYLAATVVSVMKAVYIASYQPSDGQNLAPYGIVQCITTNLTALLADSVLIFRCWVVCNRTFRVILFPIALWLGGLICTALQIYLEIIHLSNLPIDPKSWAHVNMIPGPRVVLIPFWGSVAALNAYCTFILIYKIYRATKDAGNETTTSEYRFVIRVLAESGILYLSVTVAHFVLWFMPDAVAVNILTAFNLPLIGIAFNFVVIRTAANRCRIKQEHANSFTTSLHPQPHACPYPHSYPQPLAHKQSSTGTCPNSPALNFSRHQANDSSASLGFISVGPGLKIYDPSCNNSGRNLHLGVNGGSGGPGSNIRDPQRSNPSTATSTTFV